MSSLELCFYSFMLVQSTAVHFSLSPVTCSWHISRVSNQRIHEKCLAFFLRSCKVLSVFFVTLNSFSNNFDPNRKILHCLKETKKIFVKKNRGFVGLEFVKTCHEHYTGPFPRIPNLRIHDSSHQAVSRQSLSRHDSHQSGMAVIRQVWQSSSSHKTVYKDIIQALDSWNWRRKGLISLNYV